MCTASHQTEKTSRSTGRSWHRSDQNCRAGLEPGLVMGVVVWCVMHRIFSYLILWSISIIKFKRSRAGIPSVRKSVSREIISASVELCETEVCFLHIQLFGTKVRLPKMHKSPSDVYFESSRFPAKSVLKQPQTALLCRFFSPQDNIVWIHMCNECKRSNVLRICHILWSTKW